MVARKRRIDLIVKLIIPEYRLELGDISPIAYLPATSYASVPDLFL